MTIDQLRSEASRARRLWITTRGTRDASPRHYRAYVMAMARLVAAGG
jgi:hypothetical protein